MTESQSGGVMTSSPRQVGWPVWLWIILVALLVFIAPAVGCGACGLAAGVASGTPSGSIAFGPSVGLIRIEGPIFSGQSSTLAGSIAASDTIVGLIEQASADTNIRAIVLRIDSPGGGVVASDEIYHALTRVEKPVVVSMGSMAASGGYYVAAPADHIYATPYTLTGSIGVISQFVTAQELLDEVGIEIVIIAAGESKDFGSFHRAMTDEERAYWQALIEETHEGFIRLVAEERGLPIADVRVFADGRVVTGEQAVALGLVDEIGYLDDAITRAGELGGITGPPNVVELKPEVGLLDALYGFQSGPGGLRALDLLLRELTPPSLEFRYLGP